MHFIRAEDRDKGKHFPLLLNPRFRMILFRKSKENIMLKYELGLLPKQKHETVYFSKDA